MELLETKLTDDGLDFNEDLEETDSLFWRGFETGNIFFQVRKKSFKTSALEVSEENYFDIFRGFSIYKRSLKKIIRCFNFLFPCLVEGFTALIPG